MDAELAALDMPNFDLDLEDSSDPDGKPCPAPGMTYVEALCGHGHTRIVGEFVSLAYDGLPCCLHGLP